MNRDTTNPLGSWFEFINYGLLLQVVLENCHVSACKEVGLCGMERKRLNDSFSCAEWPLRSSFSYAVDEYLTGGLQVVRHGSQVVTLGVPANTANNMF